MMSVLQRRMFSNGGPANQPLQSYAQLISSYAQKGLSVDEALVELGDPNFPRSEVERIYASLGYSIDPSITDYQILPETSGIMIGDPDLDRTFDLTDVADEPVGATLDFDVPEVTSLDTSDITSVAQVTPQQTITTTGVGANQIKLSDGQIINVNIDQFKSNISNPKYTDIDVFGMLNNPNATLGSNVKEVLENEMFQRKSSLGYDRFIGGIGDIGADLTLTKRIIEDVAKEGFENLVDAGLATVDFFRTNPSFRGLLSRREGAEQQRKLESGEIPPRVPFEVFKSPVLDEPGKPDFLGAVSRGFATTDRLDDLYEEFQSLEAPSEEKTILETESGSKIDISPEITGEILTEARDIIAEDRERIEEAEQKATEVTPDETEEDAVVTAQEETPDAKGIPEVTYTFDADLAKKIADSPTFFETDAFRRFIRNVGTGLVKTGQLGSGLAAGATLAAEEERKIEEEKREAVLESIKNQEDSGLDTSLLKILPEQDAVIAQQIKEFEGGQSSISFLQEAIKVFEEALDTGRSPTSFRGVIDKYGDQLQAFFGGQEEWDQLSATTKIERLIEVVRQKNLQAILGESGRTISDKDRQIVLSVFGDIQPGTPPLVAIKKLQESLEGLKSSQREKQSRILATQTYLLQPEFRGRGQLFLLPRIDVINRVLNTDVNAPVDIRNVESLSNLIDLYPTN